MLSCYLLCMCTFTGKVISTKREELAHIVDQFNIQVDNPVAILTQETSRNFLHSKSAHDRYKVSQQYLVGVQEQGSRACWLSCLYYWHLSSLSILFVGLQFFLKATQLQNMKNDYMVANESKEDAQRILEQKKQVYSPFKFLLIPIMIWSDLSGDLLVFIYRLSEIYCS